MGNFTCKFFFLPKAATFVVNVFIFLNGVIQIISTTMHGKVREIETCVNWPWWTLSDLLRDLDLFFESMLVEATMGTLAESLPKPRDGRRFKAAKVRKFYLP